ncbi:hypothetical protein PR048_018374 [Dryococelus australis]|uniref:Uncharacterized protein n=1 Tax=Dryococelus australis TaxID=614101 RepID=A0ABQ9HCU2_9NEOP|nr:hypothetical protein PR048_018374 [Dryococelus australis]
MIVVVKEQNVVKLNKVKNVEITFLCRVYSHWTCLLEHALALAHTTIAKGFHLSTGRCSKTFPPLC